MVEVDKKNDIVRIKTRNNKKNKLKIYNTDVLDKPISLVKVSALGLRLIDLTCKGFSPTKGCNIEIKYPYNIISGKNYYFHAILKRVKNKWGLYENGRLYNRMNLLPKKLLGLLVGIKGIQTYSE